MKHVGALALLLALLAGSAEALDVSVETYRESRRTGALGVVTGRVYTEPRTRQGAAQPFTGATVTLLPRSATLLADLERLKDRSRASTAAFTAATPAMRKARDAYERDLWEAGAPDLAVMVQVDGDGAFRFDDIPAGSWLVLGWHSVVVHASGEKLKSRERGLFQTQPRLRGFQSVTIWLREISVTGARTVAVDLTDRNGWFRGVIDERVLDAGH
jgi:hypothetical protein